MNGLQDRSSSLEVAILKRASGQEGRMRIGQLAIAAGLSTSTLRYCERLGLLPPSQRRNGKRW
jgi:hypothetical protein